MTSRPFNANMYKLCMRHWDTPAISDLVYIVYIFISAYVPWWDSGSSTVDYLDGSVLIVDK